MNVFGVGAYLLFGETMEHVRHHLKVLVQVAVPRGLGECREEFWIPVRRNELSERLVPVARRAPERLAAEHSLGEVAQGERKKCEREVGLGVPKAA